MAMTATVKYGLLPPGRDTSVANLYHHGDALVLFDTIDAAKSWLSLQVLDGKDYFKFPEVALAMVESKQELKEIQ